MSFDFNRYFNDIDGSPDKTLIMRDIRGRSLRCDDLNELLDELERKECLIDKSFVKKHKREWNTDYMKDLSLGPISDYFSREYLLYYAKVVDKVYMRSIIKKICIILGCAAVVIAVIIALTAFAIKYEAGGSSNG